MRERLQSLSECSCGLCLLEAGDQRCQSAVIHASSVLSCGDGKTDREVCLAYTGGTEEDDILLSLDKAERMQAVDLLPLD